MPLCPVATAIAVGQDALASEILPTAAVWAALAAGGALALSGRFSEGIEVAEIGSRAAESCESGPQRYALGFTEIFALTGSGDLTAAERVCQHYTAMTSGVPQAEAIVAALNGRLLLARGTLTSACEQLQRSLWGMSGSLPSTWVMLVAAWLAQAEGARGNAEAAAAGLAKAEEAISGVSINSQAEIAAAYRSLDNALPRCGPNFFTKHFYFLGKALGQHRYPLIFDDRVAGGLVRLSAPSESVMQIVRVSTDRSASAYLSYLRLAHAQADVIECEPDQVEYFLFTLR